MIPGGPLRVIRTFILRLLVNSSEPDVLRGALQPVPEGEAQSFADEQALLALLRRLTGETAEPSDTGATSYEHRLPGGDYDDKL
jgi:hypothetical protein